MPWSHRSRLTSIDVHHFRIATNDVRRPVVPARHNIHFRRAKRAGHASSMQRPLLGESLFFTPLEMRAMPSIAYSLHSQWISWQPYLSYKVITLILPLFLVSDIAFKTHCSSSIMLTTTNCKQWWIDRCSGIQRQLLTMWMRTNEWLGPWGWFWVIGIGSIMYIPLHFFIHYRSSIRKRLKDIERRLNRGLVYRDTTNQSPRKKMVRALELHPQFVKESHEQGWRLMSLGQYLSTLRINQLEDGDNGDEGSISIPKLLERELEATIGSVLLRNLGPRMGAALLPMLGISSVDSWIAKVAAAIASYAASHILVEVSESWDPTEDRATFPFAVSEIVAFVNLNQKIRSGSRNSNNNSSNNKSEGTEAEGTKSDDTTPLEWMHRGEIGYTPTYATIRTTDKTDHEQGANGDGNVDASTNLNKDESIELIPNPFILERDFEAALSGLEDRIRAQYKVTATNSSPNAEHATTTAAYDPQDRSLPEPVPINERVLPGLHAG